MDYLLLSLWLFVCYVLYGAIWRLYFSPIAHIPGPRLAALTRLYEIYYDVWLSGKYTFKIMDLHKQYGPIIRISPWEIHISDPDFYDTVYAGYAQARRSDKWPYFTKFMGLDLCVFATVEHELHRKRRSALLPYFSMASVRRLQPVIQERIDVMLNRMKEFRDTDEVLNASCMFSALTNDVTNTYSFARHDHRLETPNFDPSSRDASLAGANSANIMKHVPWVNDVFKALPDSVVAALNPALASFAKQKRTSRAQVEKIIAGDNEEWRGKEHPTIFHAALDSKLPPEEKTIDRLADDAQMMVMAGTLTTAATLELITFWLLSQPETLRKLKEELLNVMPSADDVGKIPLPTLEGLPYLTAVIKEGLRLSYGVSTRLQRIDPDNSIVYKDKKTGKEWVIPPKTPLGQTAVQIHHDEEIYPDSHKFIAERWLNTDGRRLEKYLVSFCQGSRKCLGVNLAYGELYLVLSAIFRLWGSGGENGVRGADDVGVLTLYETGLKDVEMESDQFIPAPQKGSKGIRVKAFN
ncbi:cytochrome P450 monooxygenase [Westerdykella ornata]|uniref:Cytochrome P450 monooxygenase n=1 Tax=Westerdykella ornata TaxID=318751 RepID=A0A6A6JGR1_WESOR|nr:cytochrome P450 monooxygenase [Westerdykella ornata]KAF2275384.1 cytochrome P450 monooxygenase [Westerdykella ornata]